MVVPWRVRRRESPPRVPDGLSPFAWVRWGRFMCGDANPGRKGPTMLPQPGTYKARTANGVVYETEGGALMCAFDFGIDQQTSIVGRVCLVKKDGEVLQNNVRSMKEAFGWDGADPFWLADTDLSDREVEIVVEMEQGQDGQERPTVRWINAPGRGGELRRGRALGGRPDPRHRHGPPPAGGPWSPLPRDNFGVAL